MAGENEVTIKINAELSELIKGLNSLRGEVDKIKSAGVEAGQGLKAGFSGEATTAVKNTTKAATELNNEIKAVQQSLKTVVDPAAHAALKKYEQELLAEESATNKVKVSTGGLRTELRGLVQQMAQLDMAGQKNSKTYTDLSKRAGVIKDAMLDAGEASKNMGSDTRTVEGMTQGVSGLVGAFSILQGVQVLFGSENKDFQKTMMKIMATMQMLNGVQQIATIMQKESAFMILWQNSLSKIFVTQKIIETGAVEGATGAQNAFNTSVKANPIGLIVTAIIAASAALIVYSKHVSDAVKNSQMQNDVMGKAEASIIKEKQSLESLVDIANNKNRSDKDRITALKLIKKETDGIINVQGLSTISLKNLNTQTEIYIQSLLKQAMVQAAESTIQDNAKKKIDNMVALSKIRTEINDMNIFQLTAALALSGPEIALQMSKNTLLGKESDMRQMLIDKKSKDIKLSNTELSQLDEKLLLYISNNKQLDLDVKIIKEKKLFEKKNIEEVEKMRIAAIDDDFERQTAQANYDRDFAIKTKKAEIDVLIKTKEEKESLLKEYVTFYDFEYKNKIFSINAAILKEETNRQAKLKKSVEDINKIFIDKTEGRLTLEEEVADKKARNDIANIKDEKERALKLFEYEKDLDVKAYKRKLANPTLGYTPEQQAKMLADYKNLVDSFNQTGEKANKKLFDFSDMKWTPENTKQLISGLQGAANNVASTLNQIQQDKLTAELTGLDTYYSEAEKKLKTNLENNQLTQQEYDDAILALEKEKNKKILAAKKEAWQKEHDSKLAMAIINTALGVTQALAEAGPAGIITGALVAIAGGLEIGYIASQKTPYRKGTAQILGGASHEAGGVSLGQFGEAEGGEFLGILAKNKTNRYGKGMLSLFEGLNKSNTDKINFGLNDIAIKSGFESSNQSFSVSLNEIPEIRDIKKLMQKDNKSVTYHSGYRIEKTSGNTRVIYG